MTVCTVTHRQRVSNANVQRPPSRNKALESVVTCVQAVYTRIWRVFGVFDPGSAAAVMRRSEYAISTWTLSYSHLSNALVWDDRAQLTKISPKQNAFSMMYISMMRGYFTGPNKG